jgi:ribosomal protein L25 (general stress protein Ctc)
VSEQLIAIDAEVRTKTGKNENRRLRALGKVPGVLCDNGKATSIELVGKLLSKAYKSEGRKFNLNFNGKVQAVVIKELQLDHLKRLALHVDLVPAK